MTRKYNRRSTEKRLRKEKAKRLKKAAQPHVERDDGPDERWHHFRKGRELIEGKYVTVVLDGNLVDALYSRGMIDQYQHQAARFIWMVMALKGGRYRSASDFEGVIVRGRPGLSAEERQKFNHMGFAAALKVMNDMERRRWADSRYKEIHDLLSLQERSQVVEVCDIAMRRPVMEPAGNPFTKEALARVDIELLRTALDIVARARGMKAGR